MAGKFTRGEFVTAFRNSLPAGNKCGYHDHDCVEIVYHLKGSGRMSVPGSGYERFTEGSVVIYGANVLHDQIMDEDGTDLCYLMRIRDGEWPFPRKVCRIDGVESPYLVRELQDCESWLAEERGLWKDVYDLRISALFAGLVRESLERKRMADRGPASQYASEARKIVEAGIGQTRRVSDVSAKLGLSCDYTRHIFKTEYGVTLTDFILKTRVARAKDLLRFSAIGLKEIAPLCGFANERQMSVTFRRLTGIAPGAYRNTPKLKA